LNISYNLYCMIKILARTKKSLFEDKYIQLFKSLRDSDDATAQFSGDAGMIEPDEIKHLKNFGIEIKTTTDVDVCKKTFQSLIKEYPLLTRLDYNVGDKQIEEYVEMVNFWQQNKPKENA
jgi:hypothetical protein